MIIFDRKIRLAIIEDNKRLSSEIWNYLKPTGKFVLAGTAEDGESGLKLLIENDVDAVLLDIIMPRKDGLYVLEKLESIWTKNRPICVVLSSTNSETVKAKAFDLGVDYYILKPFDMHLLYSRLIDLVSYKNPLFSSAPVGSENEAEDYAVSVLTSLGVKETLKGYEYIKTGVTMAIYDNTLLESVTKCLYPAVAKVYGTNPANVERGIRHALETFKNSEHCDEAYITLFGSIKREKLTNRRLLKILAANYLRK